MRTIVRRFGGVLRFGLRYESMSNVKIDGPAGGLGLGGVQEANGPIEMART